MNSPVKDYLRDIAVVILLTLAISVFLYVSRED